MVVEKIDVNKTIKEAEKALEAEKNISHTLKSIFSALLVLIKIMAEQLGKNSKNSSIPPSNDPNKKKKKKTTGKKKPGGQKGHEGSNLKQVQNPDEVQELEVDRRSIPNGNYTESEPEVRQVIDLIIERHVIEYRAQVLIDEDGNRWVASFPDGVNTNVQYGNGVKADAVYNSQYQLIPYERVQDDLENNAGIPISTGTLVNFNKEVYDKLEQFEDIVKKCLIDSSTLNADETGINVNGKRIWLHGYSNSKWTYYCPHEKRGIEAMNDAGILPSFKGVCIHDHWKPYFTFLTFLHALCNAHHLRELEAAIENDECKWAKKMQDLLISSNKKADSNGGMVSTSEYNDIVYKYRAIISAGEIETPEPPPKLKKNGEISKAKPKRSKTRNLLERLRDFEEETLRFLLSSEIEFTNNLGERDIRMTKVQQKISGCFRSMNGAKIFCRIRGFISTCKKHNVSPSKAIKDLLVGKLPDFVSPP